MSAEATHDPHHGGDGHGDGADAGQVRETFRKVTNDVAWIAEAPKPHKLGGCSRSRSR